MIESQNVSWRSVLSGAHEVRVVEGCDEESLKPRKEIPRFARNDNIHYLGFSIVILLLTTLVRTLYLGSQSFSFDEIDRVYLARLPLEASLRGIALEGLHSSPLLFLLLRPFVNPLSETLTRLPMVFCGVITVAIIAALARRWLGQWGGIAALWLFALNLFLIWFSRLSTMYGVMLLGVAGSFWAFGLLLDRRRPLYFFLFGVFTFIGIFTHHFAFAAPLVQFIFILLQFKRHHKLFVPWAITNVVAGIPLAIWLWWSVVVLKVSYVASAAQYVPTLLDVLKTLWNFSLVYTEEFSIWIAVSWILFFLAFITGMWSAAREQLNQGWLILLWSLLPLAVAFVLSYRLKMYVDRYISAAALGYLLLVVAGVSRFGRWRNVMLIALIIISTANVTRIYFDQKFFAKEGWRESIAHVQANERDGDVLIAPYIEQFLPFFVYYQGKLPFKGITEGQRKINKVDELKGDAKRVWLFTPHGQDSTHLLAACLSFDQAAQVVTDDHAAWIKANESKMIERTDYPCITVFLYDFTNRP